MKWGRVVIVWQEVALPMRNLVRKTYQEHATEPRRLPIERRGRLGRCNCRFPRRFQSVQVVICGVESEWNYRAVTRSADMYDLWC